MPVLILKEMGLRWRMCWLPPANSALNSVRLPRVVRKTLSRVSRVRVPSMALRIALNHPSRFAGVLSLCGAFPTGRTPFGNLVAARQLPIFLATGRGSQEYPATQVCDDLRLLHTAGLSITLRQYPCGHELMPQMLTDVDRWIIEQITQPRPEPTTSAAEWSRETD